MAFAIAQLLGLIALMLSIVGLQQNTTRKFLFFQVLINVLYTLQYFLLGATTGLSMCLVNTIRCIVFYSNKKKDNQSIVIFLLFLVIYLFLGICAASSLFDVILIIGTLMYTYSLWQSKMKITRVGTLISIISYIIYNLAVSAYSALILDFIDFVSISIAIIRYDILQEKKVSVIK